MNKKSNTLITYTNMKKTLLESMFNPKEAVGPIKIIMEVNDANYYVLRAVEFINEARNYPLDVENYNEKITKAISLLALAKLVRNNNQNNKEE